MNSKKIDDLLHSFAGKNVLVATHISPDGDAIGSSCGIAYLVNKLSCDVRLFYEAELPEPLSWLPLPCPCVNSLDSLGDWIPDLLILVDCGDADRSGEGLKQFFKGSSELNKKWTDLTSISIDHHEGNPLFADYNWIDSSSSATGELIGTLAQSMGVKLSGSLGEYIYLSLVSDTGNFCFANTHQSTLAMAAEIVSEGLDVGAFTEKRENQWSINKMQLWGTLMGNLQLYGNGTIVACQVTNTLLEKYGVSKDDLEGFASWMQRVKDTKITLFASEKSEKECKISLRSVGGIDVRSVAAMFNGGGHKFAAGATIAMPIEKAVKAVLEKLLVLTNGL